MAVSYPSVPPVKPMDIFFWQSLSIFAVGVVGLAGAAWICWVLKLYLGVEKVLWV
ncbi:hypothetical protein IQ06DRAFT_290406 [Phaeosphaeriaceae sp. SRC1lsM3a]|nr:hypothetical protein IQ06DRAFT_290406 [Stagonospora sp. SRC1lsM3a]